MKAKDILQAMNGVDPELVEMPAKSKNNEIKVREIVIIP